MRYLFLMVAAPFLAWNAVMAQMPASKDDAPKVSVAKFEVRVASATPEDGWIEMVAPSDGRTYWVSESLLANNLQCAEAQVTLGDPKKLIVRFKDGLVARIKENQRSVSGPLLERFFAAVFVDDELISVNKIDLSRNALSVTIDGLTEQDARRIAAGMFLPGFRAQMLFVKADWSTVDKRDTLAREMQEALGDTVVSEALIDRLPGSATEILFPSEIAAYYDQENFARLRAWLRSNDLLVDVKEFVINSNGRFGRTFTLRPNVLGLKEVTVRDQPFVRIGHEFEWDLYDDDDSTIDASRTLGIKSTARGQSRSKLEKMIDKFKFDFHLPEDRIAVINAFPESADSPYAEAARREGLVLLLAAGRADFGSESAVQTAELCLPDSVELLHIGFTHNGQFPPFSTLSAADIPDVAASRYDMPVAAIASTPSIPEAVGYVTNSMPVKVFALRNLSAVGAAKLLTDLYADDDVHIASDSVSNTVIVRGREDVLLIMEAILLRLDTVDRPASIHALSASGTENATDESSLKEAYERAEADALASAEELRPLLGAVGGIGSSVKRIAELRAILEERVSRSFELRQALNLAELTEMAGRIEDAKKSLELRDRIQDQIVARRIEDLLNPDVQWPEEP